MKRLLKSHIALLAWRLALLYAVLAICRAIFWRYNYAGIGPLADAELPALARGALLFDTVSVLYANALLIVLSLIPLHLRERRWWQRMLYFYYVVVNALLVVAVNLGDAVYFRYTQKRFTAEEIFFADNDNSLQLVGKFMAENIPLLLAGIGLIALLVLAGGRKARPEPLCRRPLCYYGGGTVLLVVAALLSVAGMRGGVTRMTRPVTLSNATLYASDNARANLILSNPFCILRTVGSGGKINYERYFAPEELDGIYTPVHRPDSVGAAPLERRNVVVFVMESMSAEHSAHLHPELYADRQVKGYTPFLDSLMQAGYCFERMYANGTRSIQALPAVLGSIPSFKTPFVLMPQALAPTRQLPRILRDKGYATAFFCGSAAGSMGFGAYARSAGIERLYSREDYEARHGRDDFDGYWGIWDEPFLQYAGEEMSALPEPFFAALFTLSSHHPFVVPDALRATTSAWPTPTTPSAAFSRVTPARSGSVARFLYSWPIMYRVKNSRTPRASFPATITSSACCTPPTAHCAAAATRPSRKSTSCPRCSDSWATASLTSLSGATSSANRPPKGASPSPTTADSRPSAATACSSSTSGARPAPTARTTCAANTIWETIPKRQRWKDASKPSSSNITVTSNKKISPSNNPMEFRPVRLEDKAAIERFTRPSGICNCDLAFANMYCWEGTYRSAWCVEEGFLLIRFYIDGSHHIGYMQPLGEGDFTHLIPSLEADARAAGQPLRISGLTPEGAAAVRRAHPEFGIWRNRDYEDYVYRADDLRNLTGRRYQPKRNHINRFEAAYDYRYEELTPALAPECMRLEREWRAGHDSHAAELTAEQRAMQRAFDHFGKLELRGGALFVGEKLVAFTIGSAINDEAFCIHVEKADTRYDGAFTMINRLFAQHLPPHYTLIDREEDLGLEGLRQSKLSYHPLFLQPKLTAQRLTEEQLQLRALWLACFPEDTQDDVEQFLLSRYDERRCLVARRDGRIAAMLHIVPFRDTAYIYAVATAPDCRQQGLAGGLLREALDRCRAEGFRYAALIPGSEELRRWYAGFGFAGDYPACFRTHDDFDFGTGDPAHDRAMVLPLTGEPFAGETLDLSDLPQES